MVCWEGRKRSAVGGAAQAGGAVTALIRTMFRRYAVLATCAVLGIGASFVILAHRYEIERAYHTVEITADGDDWTTLARRDGVDLGTLYAALRERGVRSVTLYAASLRRLSDRGMISYMTGTDVLNAARTGALGGPLRDMVRQGRIRPNSTYILGDPEVLRLVQQGFADQLGASRSVLREGSGPVLEIGARGQEVEDSSLGVPPGAIQALHEHELAAELRVLNFHYVAAGGLEAFFADLRRAGQAFTLIFDRDQVLGYDALIPDVAGQMKASGFAFGRIEAFMASRKQKGEDGLTQLVAPDMIRVFSMTPQELATSSPDDARDKFVLAARERNVRILYVRPFLSTAAGVDEMQTNLDYVKSIADELTQAGFKLGKAVPMPVLSTPAPLFGLAALGTLSVAAITTAEVWGALARPVPTGRLHLWVGAGVLLTVAALALHHVTLWRELLAFLAALAFPTLGMMWLVPGARREDERGRREAPTRSGFRAFARGVAGLWTVSAMSVLGAFVMGALLSEWSFMMEVREFLGVKLAHIVPVVVIGLLVAAADAPPGELWGRLRRWLRQPLLLQYGVVLLLIGTAAVFALGRTGNSGLPVLGALELKSRVVLERILIARPRTKEYLVGDPFMVLAFALAAAGLRGWVLPAVMIGAVGQVGLINSFSHIHTPLYYAFMRTVYALATGSLLGGVLVALLWWARRWWGPSVEAGASRASPETSRMA
ncbi:MAG TPA: DUF5693 family protein [bacterium]|nr:DUF5693 family protein [bacterium]